MNVEHEFQISVMYMPQCGEKMKAFSQGVLKVSRLQASAPPARSPLGIRSLYPTA